MNTHLPLTDTKKQAKSPASSFTNDEAVSQNVKMPTPVHVFESQFTAETVTRTLQPEEMSFIDEKHLADPRVFDVLSKSPVILFELGAEARQWAKEIHQMIRAKKDARDAITSEWFTIGYGVSKICECGAFAQLRFKTRGDYIAHMADEIGITARQLQRWMSASSNWLDCAMSGAPLPMTITEAVAMVSAAENTKSETKGSGDREEGNTDRAKPETAASARDRSGNTRGKQTIGLAASATPALAKLPSQRIPTEAQRTRARLLLKIADEFVEEWDIDPANVYAEAHRVASTTS